MSDEMCCPFCGGYFDLDDDTCIEYCPLCGEKLD